MRLAATARTTHDDATTPPQHGQVASQLGGADERLERQTIHTVLTLTCTTTEHTIHQWRRNYGDSGYIGNGMVW